MDDKLIIVSSDSHAGMPTELWPRYLEKRFRDLIPRLHEDHEIYQTAIYLLNAKTGTSGLPEHQEAHQADYHGLHDAVLRLADMDREGITAERLGEIYASEICESGDKPANRG